MHKMRRLCNAERGLGQSGMVLAQIKMVLVQIGAVRWDIGMRAFLPVRKAGL